MSTGQGAQRSGPVRATEVAERATATRDALVVAARRLFVANGYAATRTEDIVEAAGVGTRGALYHHFADKRALFLTVYEQVHAELVANAGERAEGNALERLRSGLLHFMDASLTPDVQRMLIDGPAVLTQKERQAHNERSGLAIMRALLKRAIAEGSLPEMPIDAMAPMLLAASQEAARFVANSTTPRRARDRAVTSLNLLLNGLSNR
jgi:AcrR family transcriptional regulator